MKILLVSPFTNTSGSAIRFWNMAHQFKLMGHEVIYVERSINKNPAPIYPNIKYYTSPKLNNLFIDILISFLFNMMILLRNLNTDIYYALKPAPNNCFPALFAKFLGKRILLDIDDLDYGYFPSGLKYKLSKFFFEMFPKYFETITYHTSKLGEYIQNELKINNKKCYFLKQGISGELLKEESKRKERKSYSIVYIATLGLTTDIDDLFPLFKNICTVNKEISITIVGDGPQKKILEKQIKNLQLDRNVTFIGRIDHKDVADILQSHNIGLIYMRPSFTNNCRAILKIREYLAQKLTVVGNNSGDASLFKNNAYIEDSIEKMEKRLISILKKPSIKLNEKGYQFIKKNYSWEKIMSDFSNSILN